MRWSQVGVDPTGPFPQGYPLAVTLGAAPPSLLAARLVGAPEDVEP